VEKGDAGHRRKSPVGNFDVYIGLERPRNILYPEVGHFCNGSRASYSN